MPDAAVTYKTDHRIAILATHRKIGKGQFEKEQSGLKLLKESYFSEECLLSPI